MPHRASNVAYARLGCSWDFYEDQAGEEYLLYLYLPERPSDPFYVSACNRPNSLENANDDLLYLNNLDKLRGRTRISGVVTESDETVEGRQIRISGKNKSYSATKDKNGVYEVYDLPLGAIHLNRF